MVGLPSGIDNCGHHIADISKGVLNLLENIRIIHSVSFDSGTFEMGVRI